MPSMKKAGNTCCGSSGGGDWSIGLFDGWWCFASSRYCRLFYCEQIELRIGSKPKFELPFSNAFVLDRPQQRKRVGNFQIQTAK